LCEEHGFSLEPRLLERIEASTAALRGRDPEVLEEIVARSVAEIGEAVSVKKCAGGPF
jgi:hypothetical protein